MSVTVVISSVRAVGLYRRQLESQNYQAKEREYLISRFCDGGKWVVLPGGVRLGKHGDQYQLIGSENAVALYSSWGDAAKKPQNSKKVSNRKVEKPVESPAAPQGRIPEGQTIKVRLPDGFWDKK